MKGKLKYLIYSILLCLNIHYYLIKEITNPLVYVLDICLIILIYFIYNKYYDVSNLSKKYHILSFIISFILVLGYSYQFVGTAKLFYNPFYNLILSVLKILGYYYLILNIISYILKFLKRKFYVKKAFVDKFKEKPFFYSFLFLAICYGIFLICYYPGVLNYDNANQIKEVLGIHTRYLDAINPISNSTLTNFNPIIHTLLLGGLVKVGLLLNNFNFGLFLYTFIQVVILITIYSYAISYGVSKNVSPIIGIGTLLFLGLVPTFGYYSITAVKDTLYSAFLVLFSIRIYDFISKDTYHFQDYLYLFLTGILVCLFRNNGIYIVILTLPFLLRKHLKLKIITLTLSIFIFYTVFNNVLLPLCGISGTSIREALSIPFQQTARLVKYYDANIAEEDKVIIGKLLDYDNLAIDYDPTLADPVKNKFNKDYQKEDLINYFKVWLKYLPKYPMTYINATINNVSSYFYPMKSKWKVYSKLNPKLPEAGYDYHFNKLQVGRDFLISYEVITEYSPVGIFINMGMISWLSIIVFISLCNKNKYYIFLLPNLISIIFCILSPANTYYRYIYPSLVLMTTLLPLIKVLGENKIIK